MCPYLFLLWSFPKKENGYSLFKEEMQQLFISGVRTLLLNGKLGKHIKFVSIFC